jgi:hypothetical protein
LELLTAFGRLTICRTPLWQTQPIDPVATAPDRRKRFTVVEGGKTD